MNAPFPLHIPAFPWAQGRLDQMVRPGPSEAGCDDRRASALADQISSAGIGTSDWTGRISQARQLVTDWTYRDPFHGRPTSAEDIVAILALWHDQQMINRTVAATAGIKAWKQRAIDHLLWDGTRSPPHSGGAAGDRRAVWPTKADPRPGDIILEDGFIRSAGLGAECREPFSIAADRTGIYYDPRTPNDLETLIQSTDFTPALTTRAAALRRRLVAADISKYGTRGNMLDLPRGRRLILVPGQVEDDRSVLTGGGAIRTNAALLAAVRLAEPNAHIVYKPHPDVESGLRTGGPEPAEADELADTVARDANLTALFAQVDGVHTLTSLTGFEALLRGLPVTTYGAPFYAGWGLTDDRGTIPARRTARRSLDELVAAALILYPRYLDPVTRLPCPPEILIDRLVAGLPQNVTLLTRVRQAQGRLKTLFRRAS